MGYALHETVHRGTTQRSWKMLLLFIVIANLPDLDFLPGLLVGDANKYHHHYWSHSLGAAVVAGALIAAVMVRARPVRGFWFYFALCSGVYFSHVALDFFSHDTSAPYGVAMFWPFTTAYVTSPQPIFMSVHKVGQSDIFFQNLFVMHNFWVALWEFVVFIPILIATRVMKRRKAILAQ